jgi:hypothetical protein
MLLSAKWVTPSSFLSSVRKWQARTIGRKPSGHEIIEFPEGSLVHGEAEPQAMEADGFIEKVAGPCGREETTGGGLKQYPAKADHGHAMIAGKPAQETIVRHHPGGLLFDGPGQGGMIGCAQGLTLDDPARGGNNLNPGQPAFEPRFLHRPCRIDDQFPRHGFNHDTFTAWNGVEKVEVIDLGEENQGTGVADNPTRAFSL